MPSLSLSRRQCEGPGLSVSAGLAALVEQVMAPCKGTLGNRALIVAAAYLIVDNSSLLRNGTRVAS